MNETKAEMARKEVRMLTQWVVEHKGDVDRGVFKESCAKVLGMATDALGIRRRFTQHVRAGLPQLDVACALLGMYLPEEVLGFYWSKHLPGYGHWKQQESH